MDQPLRPSELSRTLTVTDSSLVVYVFIPPLRASLSLTPCYPSCSDFRARTIAQARVALDHALSDIQLVVQTMHKFAPKEQKDGEEGGLKLLEAPSLEVGLMGSWESVAR